MFGLEKGLSNLCAFAHIQTQDSAIQMQQQLKRIFYVTPTNYIELLKGYGEIIKQKRREVDNQRKKLRNGLSKLDEARMQVEKMSQDSEIKRADVSKQTKICEDLVIKINKEKKVADEQQIEIEKQTEKIEKEKEETMQLAAEAESELKKAEPALLAAQTALEMLDKKYIAEIKSFTQPPPDVAIVMSAVMTVLKKDTAWASVKKELADSNFVKKIMEFDKDNIEPAVIRKVEKYTRQENFQPDYVEKISRAAGALCMWVRSIEDYTKALKVVAPKRQKKAYAEEQLRKKIADMEKLKHDFDILTEKLNDLQRQYDETNNALASFKAELDNLQIKIDRGDKLIFGLSGEKSRWEATLLELDDQYEKLIGDCVLAAAFMSYCGPFPSEYRDSLISSFVAKIEANSIPFT